MTTDHIEPSRIRAAAAVSRALVTFATWATWAVLGAISGCATPTAPAAAAPAPAPASATITGAPAATLYERLGGEARVSLAVSRLIERSAADPHTARSFDGVKLSTLSASLVQHICSLSGGGCVYEGETMARAHADLKIRSSEFEAMVTILREEFDRAGIDAGARNELLRKLAPMKRDIVDPPAAALAARQP
jgi:hemoglobin